MSIVLKPGVSVRGVAGTADKASYIISGRTGENVNNPQPRLLASGYLSSSTAALYSVAPTYVRIDSIILVNTHTSSLVINLYLYIDEVDYNITPKDLELPANAMLTIDGQSVGVMPNTW